MTRNQQQLNPTSTRRVAVKGEALLVSFTGVPFAFWLDKEANPYFRICTLYLYLYFRPCKVHVRGFNWSIRHRGSRKGSIFVRR